MTVEEILAALRAIVDGATNEDGTERDLSTEEAERYEALEVQLRGAQRTDEIRKRNAAYNVVTTTALGPSAGPREDDTLERAFESYLRTGKENADLVELRAQSEGTPSEGGYLVPDGFRNKLVDRLKAFGGIAGAVEEITTDTGAPLPWVTTDDTSNVGEIVSEGGTFSSGADLVFGSANLGSYSYMAGGAGGTPLRLSRELTQDSAVDIQALVTKKLGERIARIQARHLVTGTGVHEPQGIVDGLTGIEPAATAVVYADLITWIHSVDPEYRANGRWAFNDQSLAMLRKLVDGNNRPLLQPSADGSAAGAPGGETLLGYPVTIDQGFGDYVGTNGADDIWGVFGDLREGYVIRRVRAVEILVNPYSRMANRQIEFSAWARMDAVQQNTNSYIALAGFTA